MLVETLRPQPVRLREVPNKVKLTAAVVSILVTFSALALLAWNDFGYL
jgi:hypothetical protein